MATTPQVPQPDIDNPRAPPETPSQPEPLNEPGDNPPEIEEPQPDYDDPDPLPLTTPLPPD